MVLFPANYIDSQTRKHVPRLSVVCSLSGRHRQNTSGSALGPRGTKSYTHIPVTIPCTYQPYGGGCGQSTSPNPLLLAETTTCPAGRPSAKTSCAGEQRHCRARVSPLLQKSTAIQEWHHLKQHAKRVHLQHLHFLAAYPMMSVGGG